MNNTNFGKPIVTTTVDPDILNGWGKRGYNWEFSTGIQHELLPRTSLDVGYFRRWYGNFSVDRQPGHDAGRLQSVQHHGSVDPRLPDGGGYLITGLYNLNPNKVGQVDKYSHVREQLRQADRALERRRCGHQPAAAAGRRCCRAGSAPGGRRRTTATLAAKAWTIQASASATRSVGDAGQVLRLYTVPKVDVQVAASDQNMPGPLIQRELQRAQCARAAVARPAAVGRSAQRDCQPDRAGDHVRRAR